MPESKAMDINVPNAARVYDYSLGGNHNFEADRQVAEYMFTLVPSTKKWVRLLRMFLHDAAQEMADQGFTSFLDLASGLPTVEHIHSTVPDAKVIYVDSDPVVVNYGKEILGTSQNVRFLEADIREIDSVLASPVIPELFGNNRKVAIGLNGVTVFLSDEEIGRIMQATYDWAASGSKMWVTWETQGAGLMTPQWGQFLGMFDQMGSPMHLVPEERARELVKPWKVDARGFRPITDWLGLDNYITEQDREGVGLEFYGVYLEKA
jgi:hypothetical protein